MRSLSYIFPIAHFLHVGTAFELISPDLTNGVDISSKYVNITWRWNDADRTEFSENNYTSLQVNWMGLVDSEKVEIVFGDISSIYSSETEQYLWYPQMQRDWITRQHKQYSSDRVFQFIISVFPGNDTGSGTDFPTEQFAIKGHKSVANSAAPVQTQASYLAVFAALVGWGVLAWASRIS
ncbi:hypothetical protein NM208_g8581 [Fusarium decemcellulare]|uniref:Uncharacterized protein n=1 Tax=Fusarium decemcellulare TaxID=57161 RepID=A0ACC1S4Q6_9HYPO|nr:hypothetical protein NM208_g8581 [Fusarium decemcellulare]